MKIVKRLAIIAVSASTLGLGFSGVASAHVTVKPSDVKTGTYQTFSVNVPTEKDTPTVSVKLDIPEALTNVTPSVKPGWNIKIDKHVEDKKTMVSAITWSGGEVGVGYRDEFTFSAKTPDGPVDLQWKAYQTYQNGVVVSWDQSKEADEADEADATTGPFSVTKVATESDQEKALKAADTRAAEAQQAATIALYTSIGGIVLAVIAVIVGVRKPSKE
ncbi:MAG TPA: DUF1775 domain-containing protein [Candidatus Saccharimonadales bacterium]